MLKTVGAGIGGTVFAGTASAHGRDAPRFPVWFEDGIWEMTERPPFGDLRHESTAPLWNIAPAADEMSCAQLPGFDLSGLARADPRFDSGSWGSVDLDHVASHNPFSAIWHVHFVFDKDAETPYTPSDLVNEDGSGDPLISGTTVQAAALNGEVLDVSVPFSFNCPIRPADEEHANYCPPD